MKITKDKIQAFIKIKKALRTEKYKKILLLIFLLSSLICYIFYVDFTVVFIVLSLFLALETNLSSQSSELVRLYESATDSEPESIKFKARD